MGCVIIDKVSGGPLRGGDIWLIWRNETELGTAEGTVCTRSSLEKLRNREEATVVGTEQSDEDEGEREFGQTEQNRRKKNSVHFIQLLQRKAWGGTLYSKKPW